jgi:hypothetical protein
MLSKTSHFDQVLEDVEILSLEDQLEFVELFWRRLIESRCAEIKAHIAEAMEEYRTGSVARGSAADLLEAY